MKWVLALAQTAPSKGHLEENLDTVAETARQAVSAGADLVAFPESAATGYYLEDAVGQHAVTAEELAAGVGRRLEGLPAPVDLLVGFYERATGQPYNSAAYLEVSGGKARVVHVYRKFFLPTYGMFDEERHHQAGMGLGVFDTRLGRMGVLICADVWHSVLATMLALHGAEVLLVPSASPVRGLVADRPGNVKRYERMLRGISEEHGMYTAACLLAGFEGGKGLSGGSFAFDPEGELLAQAELFEPSLVLCEVETDRVRQARARLPLLGDLQAAWPRIMQAHADASCE
jgi:predicted amidohydrolase